MLALEVVYQFQDGKDYSWCYYHLRFVKEALSWGGGAGSGAGRLIFEDCVLSAWFEGFVF